MLKWKVEPETKLYLVQPACEIDDNFSCSVIVNDLKLANVTWGGTTSTLDEQTLGWIKLSTGDMLTHLMLTAHQHIHKQHY